MVAARAGGIATAVNAAPIQWSYDGLWPLVDLAIVNREEARTLGGDGDTERAARVLLSRGAGAVLLTLGAGGSVLLTHDDSHRAPAHLTHVVDTAGAGDTFTSVFLAACNLGRSRAEALLAGAHASALAVSRAGTFSAFPSRAELAEILGRPAA